MFTILSTFLQRYPIKDISCAFLILFIFNGDAIASLTCAEMFVAQAETRTDVQTVWAQKVDTVYSKAFKSEWQKNSKRPYLEVLKIAKSNREKEALMLERLGFEIEEFEIKSPLLMDFIKNYDLVLESNRVPEKYKIRPALAFIQIINGVEEYTMIRPNIDPYPLTSNYRVWEARLRGLQMLKNVSEGRYPVFTNGLHDVYHFISFGLYPEYLINLSKGHQRLRDVPLTKGRACRLAYALEVLALADPKKINEIESLISVKNPSSESSYLDFEAAVNKLPPKELMFKAENLQKKYQSLLNKYAAGMAEHKERETYAESWNEKRIFTQFYERANVSSQTLPFESLSEGMAHMDTVLKLLLNMNSKTTPSIEFVRRNLDPQKEIEKLVRIQMTRMEYALWISAKKVDVSQWLNDTLVPEVNMKSPTLQFISDVFGKESSTYLRFLMN